MSKYPQNSILYVHITAEKRLPRDEIKNLLRLKDTDIPPGETIPEMQCFYSTDCPADDMFGVSIPLRAEAADRIDRGLTDRNCHPIVMISITPHRAAAGQDLRPSP